mmetsp:Transcript_18092/g.26754  ORF Transcript_18092/g.26754 Transcript_18092/m.26754 type:complete len:212 (+) Transcript_18092:727-1362(+)
MARPLTNRAKCSAILARHSCVLALVNIVDIRSWRLEVIPFRIVSAASSGVRVDKLGSGISLVVFLVVDLLDDALVVVLVVDETFFDFVVSVVSSSSLLSSSTSLLSSSSSSSSSLLLSSESSLLSVSSTSPLITFKLVDSSISSPLSLLSLLSSSSLSSIKTILTTASSPLSHCLGCCSTSFLFFINSIIALAASVAASISELVAFGAEAV